VKPINLSKLVQTSRHAEQVKEDMNSTVKSDPVFGHLACFQVDAVEAILDANQWTDLPFVIELYADGLTTSDLWHMFCNSDWNRFGIRNAFATALNALLCHERTRDRAFSEIIDGLNCEAEHIVEPMKTLAYYVKTFLSNVLDRLNQCRLVNGELVSEAALCALSKLGFSEILFKSAARHEDVQGFHYLLKHLKVSGCAQRMLRDSCRWVNAPKSFIKAVLGANESVSAFAYDIVDTVKTGNIARIDEIYDQPLVEQCFHEVFMELMDITSLSEQQIKAAQHFMARVITSGIDTYRTFLVQAYDPFVTIDLLKQKRLSNHQIINGVLKLYTQTAGSRDIFLLGLPIEDIHTHPEATKCFDRLHQLTGDEQYLKYSSNAHKSKQLEDAIGL
jgi:hypothetical protein